MAHGYIDIGYAEASKEHLEAFLSCFAIKRRQYNGFYAALEEKKIPLITHVADPTEFLDLAQIPAWALQAGYYYGGGEYASKEELTLEVLEVLRRFPTLKIIWRISSSSQATMIVSAV